MLAKIGVTKNLRKTLQYNEEKIKEDKAELLFSENFIKDSHQLSEKDKLDRFIQRISLNELVARKVLHISLSFDKSEMVSNEQMQLLAKRYMSGMGFEKQPYLVYRHYDAAHPHCHILSTIIGSNGDKLNLNKPQYWKSKKITENLERQYFLSRNEKAQDVDRFKVRQAQRVIYGQAGLKRAISENMITCSGIRKVKIRFSMFSVAHTPTKPFSVD